MRILEVNYDNSIKVFFTEVASYNPTMLPRQKLFGALGDTTISIYNIHVRL